MDDCGELLQVESVRVPGKGKISSTGKLGDVMKELIQAAEFFVKSKAKDFGIDLTIAEKFDIHVHVPEGQHQRTVHLQELPWSHQ